MGIGFGSSATLWQMRMSAVIAVLVLAANLAIIAKLEFGGGSELNFSGVGELAGRMTGVLPKVFASDSPIPGVARCSDFCG